MMFQSFPGGPPKIRVFCLDDHMMAILAEESNYRADLRAARPMMAVHGCAGASARRTLLMGLAHCQGVTRIAARAEVGWQRHE
jgi:hypothetical protein